MWANNEVGTVNPVRELAAHCAEHGIPFHTDAVQAVGALPVDFAASGASALTLTGHKIGGPYGVGALLLGRDVAVHAGAARRRAGARGPLRHAGRAGHRRAGRRRPRTPSTPARSRPSAWPACATSWSRPSAPRSCPTRCSTATPAVRCGRRAVAAAGQRALHLPRLRGRQPADAAGRPRHRVLDRLGLHRGGGPAEPRAAGDGRRARARPRLAAVLARPHLDRGRRAGARRGHRPGRGPRPQRRPGRPAPRGRYARGDSRAGARRDERWGRLRGGRCPGGRRRARRRPACTWRCRPSPARCAPAPAAAAPSRTPTTPAGSPTSSASRSTSGTSPSGSPRTSSRTSSPSTPPAARPTRACAATSGSSSTRCWTRRSRSASTRSAPATTPACPLWTVSRSCGAAPTTARTSPTCSPR